MTKEEEKIGLHQAFSSGRLSCRATQSASKAGLAPY
jgi:hypothetical protein